MAEANDMQVQHWSDERVRPVAEATRNLLLACEFNNGTISSVYERLTGSGGWSDGRTDGPPNLLTGGDLLAFNTVCVQLAAILRGTLATDSDKIAACNDMAAQLPIVLKACVRE